MDNVVVRVLCLALLLGLLTLSPACTLILTDEQSDGGNDAAGDSPLIGGKLPPPAEQPAPLAEWSPAQIALLDSLWIGRLPILPPDPSNRYGDILEAARLGHQLFFDTRFSGNGEVACASCHIPELMFTDGLPLADAGIGVTDRKTMTIIGAAFSPWLFWDGRKDSLWSQALEPLENLLEHGTTRTEVARLIDLHYRDAYEAVFGPLPDFSDPARFPSLAGPIDGNEAATAAWAAMSEADRAAVTEVFVNLGKAIAAYERLILPGESRFDRYVAAVLAGDEEAMRHTLSRQELDGLRLFISESARCTRCHSGPLLTNNSFHNTGVPNAVNLPLDTGRTDGVVDVLDDEFNCLGIYSDAGSSECAELRFVKAEGDELQRAFKPPTLRNVALTAPYMHAGQFDSLAVVLDHYNDAPPSSPGHSELTPLRLTGEELEQIEAFLHTLNSPVAVDEYWLAAPTLPGE